MLWREPFTGKNLVLVQISKRSLKKYRQSEDNWTYEVSEWGPRNDILGDTMSSNNAFGVTTIYLRFSHGRSHHHGDPLRKRDDLIKNNRTRPFSSIQQPQQLGNVTTYSKLIWPLDLILARKEIIKWATDESEEGQFGQDQFQKCNWAETGETWGIFVSIMSRRRHSSTLRGILLILAGVLNKICNRTPESQKFGSMSSLPVWDVGVQISATLN